MNNDKNKRRIDLENSITKAVLESGLELGTVIKTLSAVQWKLEKAKENLANKADVCEAVKYAERGLFISQDSHVQA
ncbi:MAG: hypothetical protein HFH68_05260 [Lachnospiraceae bacterium]|nr:hypothetical protein [Lachnospiraceae bacterium]